MEHFKAALRHSPFYSLMVPIHGAITDILIRKESVQYRRKADQLNIFMGDERPRDIFKRVRERLDKRGIRWPPDPHGRPLHFLYVSVPTNWEPHNIPPQLAEIGDVSLYYLRDRGFPCYTDWAETRRRAEVDLPSFVKELHSRKPIDLMLAYGIGMALSANTIRAIGDLGIATMRFHLDDRYKFAGKQRAGMRWGAAHLSSAFDLNLTNCPDSIIKYRVEGGEALFWPSGANPGHFRPLNLPKKYDVSFIGQCYGRRRAFVTRLRKRGVQVACFGQGWENGPLPDEKMPEIYAQSKINLGFGYIMTGTEQCLKGRDFEVPMCGSVYLTSHNRDLKRVFKIGEEIETYKDVDDCVIKVRRLLADSERSNSMREAARKASLERHTWEQRILSLLV